MIKKILKAIFPAVKSQRYGYVSWYQDPSYGYPRQYLQAHPAGSCCQENWGPGHHYITDINQATRFETEAEARLLTPSYDGSSDLDQRAGVIAVRI